MNQNPEQLARDNIDAQLKQCGWIVQSKQTLNIHAGPGVAIREYQTDVGPADYVLFVDGKPCGIIEAKKEDEGFHLITVEEQSKDYAKSKLKHLKNDPLPFVYESTGQRTRFTDYRDPKPRSREVFTFYRPETFREWLRRGVSLRQRLQDLPILLKTDLRLCQINAITNLEESFKKAHPRALIQMATGAGKTFTAITAAYRLLKYAKAKRILFLVDTRNLGEQAEQEFRAYVPNDDNRLFTDLYTVQRLQSSYVSTDSQICICTIQRLYSMLKGAELDESAEDENPEETNWKGREPLPVVYNERIPIEFFDFIIIDECHRSIYNLWKQVLDYFDSFLIGLTATPDNRTFGFFKQNVVSEYTHEQAVIDGVNVGHNVFLIETKISKQGSVIWKGEYIDKRERLTRKKRWEQTDENVQYTAKELDQSVVNPSQIRLVVKTFRDHWPSMFPERQEIPKTLIFAKTDSHADDIIDIVREEFGEGNDFCKKVTYKTEEDPKSILTQFRNAYHPRIAVTVDMIAVGTDVKPLEVLLFLRDVKSRNYYEQMKGRGTRTVSLDDLKKVSPSARFAKDHFVVIDAVGVTKSLKTDSRPLERQPSVPLKDLLQAVAVGVRDEDLFLSLANRLTRLDRVLTEKERDDLVRQTGGTELKDLARALVNAFDPDFVAERVRQLHNLRPDDIPTDEQYLEVQSDICTQAAKPFNGKLNSLIENLKRIHDQIIDTINIDELEKIGWDIDHKAQAQALVDDFSTYLHTHRDEIIALQIILGEPHRRRDLTFRMIKDLYEALMRDKPQLAPLRVWDAWKLLEEAQGNPLTELAGLIALLRKVAGMDATLTSFDRTVDRNFKDWIFRRHAGDGTKFTEEQVAWLTMIKETISSTYRVEKDDFAYSPFQNAGGLGKYFQLFGYEGDSILEELNGVLVS